MNIKEIDKKFIINGSKTLKEIIFDINKKLRFYNSDGKKTFIYIEDEYKKIIYIDRLFNNKFQIYEIQEGQIYSYGIFQKDELKQIGKILREYLDKKINIKICNEYL